MSHIPLGELIARPRTPLLDLRGLLLRRERGKRGEGKGKKGKGRGG